MSYSLTQKRLRADLRSIREAKSHMFYAQPLGDDLFHWHFTIRGPKDTPFEKGYYHGRIVLPSEYPHKPPHIYFLTENGRFKTHQKICLSISAHHPESWQPAWGIRLILEALISFLPSPGEGALAALDYSDEERYRLAIKSQEGECNHCGRVCSHIPYSESDAQSANRSTETNTMVSQLQFSARPDNHFSASAQSANISTASATQQTSNINTSASNTADIQNASKDVVASSNVTSARISTNHTPSTDRSRSNQQSTSENLAPPLVTARRTQTTESVTSTNSRAQGVTHTHVTSSQHTAAPRSDYIDTFLKWVAIILLLLLILLIAKKLARRQIAQFLDDMHLSL